MLLVCALAACGGGGSADPAAPNQSAAAPPAACTPHPTPLTVTLAGDSTGAGIDGSTGVLAAQTPAMLLQSLLDARFGASAAVVRSIAVPGTTSAQLAPADLTGEVRAVIFGVNDAAAGLPLPVYQANLVALRPTIIETPSPTWLDEPNAEHPTAHPHALTEAYAEAARDAAIGAGIGLADVNAYVQTLPDWRRYVVDGVHPDQELYRAIVVHSLGPVVEQQVAALLCQ